MQVDPVHAGRALVVVQHRRVQAQDARGEAVEGADPEVVRRHQLADPLLVRLEARSGARVDIEVFSNAGYGYDVRALPRRNVLVTSSFTGWSNYMMDLGKLMGDAEAMKRFGNTVVVWDLHGRKPKKVKPLRATTMVIARHDGHVYLERRPEAGIWGGLWSLPEVSGDGVDAWCRDRLEREPCEVECWQVLRHSFSHYDLDIQPILVRVDAPLSKVADSDDATWHRIGDEPPGGMAAPVHKLIERLIDVTYD